MPPFPLVQGSVGFGQTFATSTYGTTLTAGLADVQGTAVELFSSTSFDAHWIEITATNPNVTASYNINILIGAATEAVLIPSLCFRARGSNDGGLRWLFPLFIPKASRIAAQTAASSSGATCDIAVSLFNAGFGSHGLPSTVAEYGTISSSNGVQVDPGATPHTDAAWTELTSATSWEHNWLVLTVTNKDGGYTGAVKYLIDVGIGSATETVLVSDLSIGGGNTADVPKPGGVFHLPVHVTKGSRLTVRHRSSSGTAGDRYLFYTIHGA